MTRRSIKWRGISYLLIAVIASLFFISRNNEVNISQDYFIRDGVFYNFSSSELYTGKISDTLNGKVLEYEVIKGKKNGTFFLYYSNGKIEMTGLIVNNKNVDKWKYYFKDGTLESEGSFKDDLVNGEWKWYYKNGKVKEVANFINGKRDGETILYDEKGIIRKKIMFREGEIVNEVKRENSHFI